MSLTARETRVAGTRRDRADDRTSRRDRGDRASGPGRPGRAGAGRRRWPLLLAVTLVIALLAGGWFVAFRTTLLAVRQVQVHGVTGPLATSVKALADAELGRPMLSVDADAVRTRIAALPQVAVVEISKGWPNTLSVSVTPRVPVAATQANGAWWLLDADGLPYLSQPARPAKLPALALATPGPKDPATKAALDVVRVLPASVSALVSQVSAPSPYRVTLALNDGRTVIWGDASRSAQKAQILPAILARPGKTFDLSDPTMVTVN